MVGGLVGCLDLPLNLGFPRHHAFQAGRHTEEVACGRAVLSGVIAGFPLGLGWAAEVAEPVNKQALGLRFGLEIKLAAIAGREQHRLVDAFVFQQTVQQFRDAFRRYREPLAGGERGGFMADTDDKKHESTRSKRFVTIYFTSSEAVKRPTTGISSSRGCPGAARLVYDEA